MQLNNIVFPAPPCSYSTEKLFKDLIYIPKPGTDKAIPCLYLPYEQDSKLVLFFHGNAEDIGIAYEILCEIRACMKLSILAMEYPGYGLYHAEPDSETLLHDALFVYDHLNLIMHID